MEIALLIVIVSLSVVIYWYHKDREVLVEDILRLRRIVDDQERQLSNYDRIRDAKS